MNDSVARTLIQILSSSITSLLMSLLFYKLYKPKYHNKTVYIITFFFSIICIVLVNQFFIKMNIVSLKQKADCIISYTQNDFQGGERKNIG